MDCTFPKLRQIRESRSHPGASGQGSPLSQADTSTVQVEKSGEGCVRFGKASCGEEGVCIERGRIEGLGCDAMITPKVVVPRFDG